jgi:hypothetical protein
VKDFGTEKKQPFTDKVTNKKPHKPKGAKGQPVIAQQNEDSALYPDRADRFADTWNYDRLELWCR